MAEAQHPGYGGFYHRFRRDLIQLLLSIKAWAPLDIARYAFEHTAFYRRHYGSLPSDFAALPLVTRQLVTECDPYDLLSDEMADSIVAYVQTYGSGGAPVPAFLTEAALQGARSSAKLSPFVSDLEFALEENRAAVIGLPPGFTPHTRWFDEILRDHGAVVAHVDPQAPRACAQTLARLRPSVIVATPTDFTAWMWLLMTQHPKEYLRLREHLRGFLAHGEVLGKARQAAMAREFGITVVDIYAAGEGFSAVPCACGDLHLLSVYVCELADEKGRLTGTSGEGRLVFTNLLRRSTPMVRYLLDDYVTVTPCKCPHGFTRSIVPHGRFADTAVVGERRLGPRHFADTLYAHGMFGDFRIVLHPDGTHIAAEIWGPHPEVGTLRNAFQSQLGVPCQVELVPFGTLSPIDGATAPLRPRRLDDRRRPSENWSHPGAGPSPSNAAVTPVTDPDASR